MDTHLSFLAIAVLASHDAEPFGGLEGCWQSDAGTREVWTRGAPDLLFGFNVVSRDGQTVFFEDLRIEKRRDVWRLVASPMGRAPTVFDLKVMTERSVIFENPQHDFPQRIGYEWENDSLSAYAELLDGEARQSWSFRACSP